MTVEEIEMAANKSYERLAEVRTYLNESGQAALQAHHIIAEEALFSSSREALKDGLLKYIATPSNNVSAKTESKLKSFIKRYLEV